MTAVIGSKGLWNRDPAKMPRTYGETYQTFIGRASSDLFSNRMSDRSALLNTGYITHIETAAVANTARTIVNISGKSGWLTWAMGSCGASQAVTYVVTIDGVATTIAVNADGSDQTDTGGQNNTQTGFLGLMLNHHGSAGYTDGGVMSDAAWIANNNVSSNNKAWNAEHQTLNMGSYNDANSHNRRIVDPFHAIHKYPSSVCRFETSMTVTVAGTIAAGSSDNTRFAAVIYVLDS
jgi:hypothetical protein